MSSRDLGPEAYSAGYQAKVTYLDIWTKITLGSLPYLNYIAAMNYGLDRLASLPSRRLLCEVHEVLMQDVRGREPYKTPGQIRLSQNWIGGGSPSTAKFVPPLLG